MSAAAVECLNVWKKFTRGERADSLRDAFPALARWCLRRGRTDLGSRQFWALQDVSFRVDRGQALGIIGPNGAGKSTLLRILSSIMQPNRGIARVDGRLTALIEVGAGFHNDLTGRENIYLNGAILGMSRREITRKIGDIVEFAGVAPFIDTPVKRYSSGMQARLGFSVAAHMDPDILLVDEVLAVGDAEFQQRCLEKMHHFANSGRAIVFISHNLQAISELCPQAMLLIGGRRAFLGPTGEAVQHYLRAMRESDDRPAEGPVAVQGVTLLDTDGRACSSFKSGDRAQLQFTLRVDRPVSEYLLTFALRRITDGLVVADYNLPLPIENGFQGGLPMAVDFDANLLTGAYSITLLVVDRATYDKIVKLEFVKMFDVQEPQARTGVVHVAPRLRALGGCVPAAV